MTAWQKSKSTLGYGGATLNSGITPIQNYINDGWQDTLKGVSTLDTAKSGGLFSNIHGKLKGFNDKLGGLGNIGSTIGGVANIAGGMFGFYNARKSLKEQKRANSLLEQQWREQSAMYKEDRAREQEAHKAINDSAKHFVL